MRKNCKNFIQWAQSQYDELPLETAKHLFVSVVSTTSSVIATVSNDRTGKRGHATVKTKNFDDPTMIAVALAWTDYKGEKIPDFKVPLCHLTTSDKFIYNGKEYRYLTSNPYTKDHVIICDYSGTPSNLHKLTRVTPC